MDGVFGVAVAEVVLDQTQVITLVGEVEAAGMAQHVWLDRRQASACGSRSDQINKEPHPKGRGISESAPLSRRKRRGMYPERFTDCRVSGWPRSEVNNQGRASDRVERCRLIARNSSPAIGRRVTQVGIEVAKTHSFAVTGPSRSPFDDIHKQLKGLGLI